MKLNKDQDNLIKDGVHWSIFTSLTRTMSIPFAVALGVSGFLIGIISAIPFIASILAEIPGIQLMEKYRDRKVGQKRGRTSDRRGDKKSSKFVPLTGSISTGYR